MAYLQSLKIVITYLQLTLKKVIREQPQGSSICSPFFVLFGSVLLQFVKVGATKMPQNTYGDILGPAAGVYEYVYFKAAPLPCH
jgi:hypothetical protein